MSQMFIEHYTQMDVMIDIALLACMALAVAFFITWWEK